MDYFLARYHAGVLGRFNTVDPANAGALPIDPQRWNAYSYVRSNPLLFIDPTGETLTVADAGDAADAQSDLCQALGTADCRQRYSRDQKTGVVTIDLSGIDLTKNEGASLLNDVMSSSSTYNLSYGNTVDTAAGPQPLEFVANFTNTADWRYGNGKPSNVRPPVGIDAQVGFNWGNISSISSKNSLSPPPRYTTVFHELAEAFATVDGGQQYVVKSNPTGGAHATAIGREQLLHGQRASLKNTNLGAGNNRPGGPNVVLWNRIKRKPPY